MKILSIFVIGLFMITFVSAQTDVDRTMIPSSPFYGLKIAMENVRMAFTFGEENKIDYGLHLSEKRIVEMQRSLNENEPENLDRINRERERIMNSVVVRVTQLQDYTVIERVDSVLQIHKETLEDVKTRVPQEAQRGLNEAIEQSKRHEEGIKRIQPYPYEGALP